MFPGDLVIGECLAQLAPDAPVNGIALVHRALAEREGTVIEGTFEDTDP